MYDIVGLGELLIDFTDVGESENGMRLFERNPGGAVANVLCAAARFGMRTAFIGKVGDDMHGEFLVRTLADAGVDTAGIVRTDSAFTTLAFVSRDRSGERSFSFARKPGADTLLEPAEVDAAALRNTRIFHIGSLSLTDDPARSATLAALRSVREHGAVISYDPNYRAPLWRDMETAREAMVSVLPMADLVKISEEELRLVVGMPADRRAADAEDTRRGMEIIAGMGPRCVVVTRGERGAAVLVNGRRAEAPGFACRVIDTTGAGDAFWGAFLYQLLVAGGGAVAGRDAFLDRLTAEEAAEYARFANAAAALCIGKRGAIPAMPSLEEVSSFLHPRGAEG